MSPTPTRPKIYHITHVTNLVDIATEGFLVCDATMINRGGPKASIGMSSIKRRRIEELPVPQHSGTKVGDYVPFNLCPRSVMLYVIHRRNHPELTYTGGQGPIVHLECDLQAVAAWASKNSVLWAFSLSNAGSRYAEFRSSIRDLDELDWAAISQIDFRSPEVKERKQAEFLVHRRFPFELVERIGVSSEAIKVQATAALLGKTHEPPVEVRPEWYF